MTPIDLHTVFDRARLFAKIDLQTRDVDGRALQFGRIYHRLGPLNEVVDRITVFALDMRVHGWAIGWVEEGNFLAATPADRLRLTGL